MKFLVLYINTFESAVMIFSYKLVYFSIIKYKHKMQMSFCSNTSELKYSKEILKILQCLSANTYCWVCSDIPFVQILLLLTYFFEKFWNCFGCAYPVTMYLAVDYQRHKGLDWKHLGNNFLYQWRWELETDVSDEKWDFVSSCTGTNYLPAKNHIQICGCTQKLLRPEDDFILYETSFSSSRILQCTILLFDYCYFQWYSAFEWS